MRQVLNPRHHHRGVQVTEPRHLCGPIVLLDIDVDGIVRAPRRQQMLVPEPLQVGRNPGSARRGDEQIASEIEIQFLKVGIMLSQVGISFQLHIGGERGHGVGSGAEVEYDTSVELAIIGTMRPAHIVIPLGHSVAHYPLRIRGTCLGCCRVEVETAEPGGIRNPQCHVAATLQTQPSVRERLYSSVTFGLHQSVEGHSASRSIVQLLVDLRIARHRIICGAPGLGDGRARGDSRVRNLRVERHSCREGLRILDTYHYHRVGRGCEIGCTSCSGSCRRLGHREVKGTGILSRRTPVVIYHESAKRLIILAIMPLHTILQRIGASVILGKQGLANLGNRLMRVRISHRAVRLTGPQRDVVQRNGIRLDTTIYYGSETAVADYDSLLKKLRRPVKPQSRRRLRRNTRHTGSTH